MSKSTYTIFGIILLSLTLWLVSPSCKSDGSQAISILNEQIRKLQSDNGLLDSDFQAMIKVNAQNNDTIFKLKKQLEASEVAIAKATAELKAAKKPKPLPPVDSTDKVIALLQTHYGDTTAKFQGNDFTICKDTTYKVVSDGVNWKINSPIYEDNAQKCQKAVETLQAAYNQSLALNSAHETKEIALKSEADLQGQLNEALRKELKTSERKGNWKLVGGVAGALATCYLVNSITRK